MKSTIDELIARVRKDIADGFPVHEEEITALCDALTSEIAKRDAALLRERASNKSLRKMLRIPLDSE